MDASVDAPDTSENSEAGVEQQKQLPQPDASDNAEGFVEQQKQVPPQPRRVVSVWNLTFVVLILVPVSCNLVPLRDILFALFASAYIVLFHKFVFPSPTQHRAPRVFPRSRLLFYYVAFASLIAILIAIAYIVGSFVKGDHEGMAAASPHLFLIACQVLTEIVVASVATPVSLPVVMLVPIFYNTRRLFTISTWLEIEFARGADDIVTSHWLYFGRGLAVANMAVWAFNLFCFLLPVYLPRGIRMHSDLERLAKEHRS